jgi:hypothetical protein
MNVLWCSISVLALNSSRLEELVLRDSRFSTVIVWERASMILTQVHRGQFDMKN